MLELSVYDEDREVMLKFEHSLLSLSKWEGKHKKAFLGTKQKNSAEMIEYFEEMLISPSDRNLVYLLEPEQLEELTEYINEQRTASSVPDTNLGPVSLNQETVTSELIYYWMVALRIPFDAEKWHLSRLMMLVRITNFKQSPPEKQNKAKMAASWREINARRKAQYNTTG